MLCKDLLLFRASIFIFLILSKEEVLSIVTVPKSAFILWVLLQLPPLRKQLAQGHKNVYPVSFYDRDWQTASRSRLPGPSLKSCSFCLSLGQDKGPQVHSPEPCSCLQWSHCPAQQSNEGVQTGVREGSWGAQRGTSWSPHASTTRPYPTPRRSQHTHFHPPY